MISSVVCRLRFIERTFPGHCSPQRSHSRWVGLFRLDQSLRNARQRIARAKANPGRADEAWLQVRGTVSCGRGTWGFVDPCLTEVEAVELAAWADRRPWPDSGELRFLEPCISFAAAGMAGQDLLVQARFKGEAAPPWLYDDPDRDHLVWHKGWTVELAVEERQLAEFAAAIRRMLGMGR